jgi:uncharacterized protein
MGPPRRNGLTKLMIRKAHRHALLALALVLGGPASFVAPAAAQAPAAAHLHPISGLAVIPLKVETRHGVHVFQVEDAVTMGEQERGLMFRKAMGADEGMIFPKSPPARTAFWMKNTVLGLDIIFIGPDHRVLNIARNAVPFDETPLPSAGDVSGVLELNAGRAAQLGIEPGDLVRW